MAPTQNIPTLRIAYYEKKMKNPKIPYYWNNFK
jgi:hypothetical protein